MAAALPADPQLGDERAVQAAALLGAAYLSMGSLDYCAALSERMLAAAERACDQLVIAMNTAMLAGVCYVRGDWDRGRGLVGRALECFAASSSPVAVRWVGLLAPALIWHGAWDQARAYLEGSLQAARSVQLVSIEWTALTHLADLDLLDGRPQGAVAALHPVTADRPLPAVEDLTWDTPVELLSVLAEAHLDVGDLDRARAYAGRASSAMPAGWEPGCKASRALEVHGMVLARDGDHDLARAAYQEGPGPRPGHALSRRPGPAAARLRPARPPAARPRRRAREVRPGAGHPRPPGGGPRRRPAPSGDRAHPAQAKPARPGHREPVMGGAGSSRQAVVPQAGAGS